MPLSTTQRHDVSIQSLLSYLSSLRISYYSQVKTTGQEAVDSSIILVNCFSDQLYLANAAVIAPCKEMMSETSIQLRSQASLGNTSIDSNGNTIIPFGLTQARKQTLNKPRFIEFACNYVEVTPHDPIPCIHLLILPIDAGLPLRRFGHQRCDTQGTLGQQEESRNHSRMLVSSCQTNSLLTRQ